jgi:NADPH:quinone reductase-like Zn-dependent oxidoreductase
MPAGFSPKLDDQVAEAVEDRRVLAEARLAVDVADSPDPLGDPIEVAELSVQGRQDGEAGQASCLVPLLERQVPAHEALNQWIGAIERPVTGHIREPTVYLDELEGSRRDERSGKHQPELVQAALDSTHATQSSSEKTEVRMSVVSLPASMRAIRLHAPGGLDELVDERLDTPSPGKGEALVRVHAAAITRDELAWPADRLPATPSYELSGVVAAVGPGVDDLPVGAAVYALADFERDGAAAEYAVVAAELLAPKPQALGHVESAAVPLAALSAWQGLFDHGKLAPGERVLVHGAAGGVGSFAVQLARHRGAHVIGTASTSGVDTARELGADEVVDNTRARFEEAVDPVDLVFDTAGGELLERSPAILRDGGRLVTVAEEPSGEGVYFIVEPNREQLAEIGRLADGGALRALVDSVFPLGEAREAFERSMQPGKRGKVVLRVVDD